ncbi:hypothetical protein GEMRC1_014025 [Eukaryota sp. GEM-RC1]
MSLDQTEVSHLLEKLDAVSTELDQIKAMLLQPEQRRHSVMCTSELSSLSHSFIVMPEQLRCVSTRLNCNHESMIESSSILYRATIDGWSASIFHSLCDDLTHLLVLFKLIDGSICGAFTGDMATFTGKEHKPAPNSFLFSISNPHGMAPFVLDEAGVESSPEVAGVNADPLLGPSYGIGDLICMLESRTLGTSKLGMTFWNYSKGVFDQQNVMPDSHSSRTLLCRPNTNLAEIEVYILK